MVMLAPLIRAEEMPTSLYKILTIENWKASQGKERVVLSKDDTPFIHFSTEEQLDKIRAKYWANVPIYVILKVNPGLLIGDLRFESNPGGLQKYYHLYNGYIPLKAVVSSEVIHSKSQGFNGNKTSSSH